VEFVACSLVVNSLALENKSHGKIMNKIIFIFKEEKCLAQCQGFTTNITAGHLATTAYKENLSSRLTAGSCN
jgi:hypothetical protein